MILGAYCASFPLPEHRTSQTVAESERKTAGGWSRGEDKAAEFWRPELTLMCVFLKLLLF